MRHITSPIAFALLTLAALWPGPGQSAPTKVDLAKLQRPTVCPGYATLQDATNSCKINADIAGKIKDETTCNRSPQLRYVLGADGKQTCEVIKKEDDNDDDKDGDPSTFSADCLQLAGHKGTRVSQGKNASCEYQTLDAAQSARGDYVGDCFVIKSSVPGLPVTGSRHWFVTAQDDANQDDPNLTLVPASDWGNGIIDIVQRITPGFGCGPKTTSVQPVSMPASTLSRHGAIRRGFVYGVLTTPYKYFPGDKGFETGLPIGPYLGWRTGQSGLGGTVVAAFTLGAVKADTTMPDPTDSAKKVVTGRTDLMALSLAGGYVVDITRNVNKSSFKMGVLIGRDHVNQSQNISYPHNRKTWVAIQLGFDFTDY